MRKRRLPAAVIVALCAACAFGAVTFWAINAFFVDQAERSVESLLLSQRGMHLYIQRVMHPTLYSLKNKGAISEEFYSPQVFSSSYIVREQHRFYNAVRQAQGLEPVYYKMAATNPRNSVNLADSRESELIGWFNQHREVKKRNEIVNIAGRDYLSVTMPFLENNPACLRCHGDRRDAPVQLQELYPGPGGFNEQLGHIRAIESIRIPINRERRWAWVIAAMLVAGVGAFGLVVSLNRVLSRKVEERTEHLAKETAERRRAEEALRITQFAVDTMSDAVFQFDANGRFVYVNDAAVTQLGYTRDELLSGMSVSDVSMRIAKDPGQWRDVWKALACKGRYAVETGNRRKDGVVVPVEVRVSHTRFGDLEYGWGTARDLTERKRLELQVIRAQKMEAIATLASGIAHDFNNILSAITGFAQLAYDGLPETSASREDIWQVIKASDRARDLVRQILALARRKPRSEVPMRIGLVVREALKLLRASLPATIEMNDRIDMDLWANADPTGMHQIVMNLCTNAFAAMRESGGLLEVELAVANADLQDAPPGLTAGEYVRLRVRDTGVGIDAVALEHVFEPFYTTKRETGGTGLGLSVVHGLVNSYGGVVTVDSALGRGTTFDVWLPRVSESAAVEAADPNSSPRGAERILVVDDEADVRRVTSRMLQTLGYTVQVASEPTEAEEVMRGNSDAFDLVLTDQTMPKMTGLALSARLKQLRPTLRVLLMTGYSQALQGKAARDLEVEGLLHKPFTKEELARAVRGALDVERHSTSS